MISRSFVVTAAVAALCLAGCGTIPDVEPFADVTEEVSDSIIEGGRAVEGVLKGLDSDGSAALTRRFVAAWKERRQVAEELVDYAEGLASVAAAGRDGGDVVQGVAGTFGKLLSAIPLPHAQAATAALGIVGEIGDAIEDAIAHVRAANALEEAIGKADPAIQAIAKLLQKDFGDLAKIAADGLGDQQDALRQKRQSLLDYRSGLIAYRDRKIDRVTTELSNSLERGADDDPKLVSELQGMDVIDRRVAATASWHDGYVATLDRLSKEIRSQREVFDLAKKTVSGWAKTHADLKKAIETGTGLNVRVLLSTAQRLQKAVDELRNLNK